ncbi:Transport and Golgi organization protein 1, partial [Bienertia sinuspersici]
MCLILVVNCIIVGILKIKMVGRGGGKNVGNRNEGGNGMQNGNVGERLLRTLNLVQENCDDTLAQNVSRDGHTQLEEDNFHSSGNQFENESEGNCAPNIEGKGNSKKPRSKKSGMWTLNMKEAFTIVGDAMWKEIEVMELPYVVIVGRMQLEHQNLINEQQKQIQAQQQRVKELQETQEKTTKHLQEAEERTSKQLEQQTEDMQRSMGEMKQRLLRIGGAAWVGAGAVWGCWGGGK